MCKTLIIRRPITWGGGFHRSTRRPVFDKLLLLHLSNMDLGIRLERQNLMRDMEAIDLGAHKRAPDSVVEQGFRSWSSRRVSEPRELNQMRRQFIDSVEFFPKTGFYGLSEEALRQIPLRVFYLRSIANNLFL